MGASFNGITVNGDLLTTEVRKLFSAAQERDLHENGHSYSGGFGMAAGLNFKLELEEFDTVNDAYDWLEEHCEKWGAAIAVKAKADTPKKSRWVIGAWCSE